MDEVAAWISDREAVASSEEFGKDLEHVELLQKNFADFLKVKGSAWFITLKPLDTAKSAMNWLHSFTHDALVSLMCSGRWRWDTFSLCVFRMRSW